MNIQEDHVSFEVAKLLKDKGFDKYPMFPCYKEDTGEFIDIPTTLDTINYCFIPAPTQAIVMKWLRKVHDIHIELNWDKGNQLYSFQIWKLGKYQPEISSLDLWRIYKDDNYSGEWKYEEACEAAIKYCLVNIIQK